MSGVMELPMYCSPLDNKKYMYVKLFTRLYDELHSVHLDVQRERTRFNLVR